MGSEMCIRDRAATGELPPQTHDYSVYKDPGNIGTFKFVLIRKLLAPESDVEPSERTAITLKYIIRRAAGTPARWYGLENSNVSFEYVPLFTKFKAVNKMHEKLTGPAEPEPEKEPEPTKEELLLAEIRDLLKEQSK